MVEDVEEGTLTTFGCRATDTVATSETPRAFADPPVSANQSSTASRVLLRPETRTRVPPTNRWRCQETADTLARRAWLIPRRYSRLPKTRPGASEMLGRTTRLSGTSWLPGTSQARACDTPALLLVAHRVACMLTYRPTLWTVASFHRNWWPKNAATSDLRPSPVLYRPLPPSTLTPAPHVPPAPR